MVAVNAVRRVVLGGVPEHFNVPLMRGVADGLFAQAGLQLEFRVCHGGTGEQLRQMASNDIQCCVALTEGLVNGLLQQEQEQQQQPAYKLLGTYVTSPLVWSAAAHPASQLQLETLRGTRCGISRFGSGSHLIPYLHALNAGWIEQQQQQQQPFDFVACRDFAGLRDAITNKTADYFLWELCTTQQYYDQGTLKHIGDIVPPWSAFTLATRADVDADTRKAIVRGVQASLQQWAKQSVAEKVASVRATLPGSYSEADVLKWLQYVQFADPEQIAQVKRADVDRIAAVLKEAGVVAPNVQATASSMVCSDTELVAPL
ncbi:hypothetical protein RI367_004849 [Sorochytrium milnesiophthora]